MYYLEKKKKLTDYIFWKEKFLIRVGGVIEASKTIFFLIVSLFASYSSSDHLYLVNCMIKLKSQTSWNIQ